MSYPTITVQTERGTDAAVVTVAAFETAVQRYAHRTLGNLRDHVNERAETEHRSRSWAECIALLADFDFNVDEYAGTPFCTYAPACVHCDRTVVRVAGEWIDPEATGDDAIWRKVCDSHDSFIADHEVAS